MTIFTKIQTKLAILLAIAIIGITAVSSVSAQTPDLVPCSGITCKWCDVFELIQTIINTGLVVIAPIIIVFIFYGGILYIIGSAAGSDEQITKAKSTVVDAIIGMVIVLLTWALINSVVLGLTGQPLFRFAAIDCSEIQLPDPGGVSP